MTNNYRDVISYFNKKAKKYDLVDGQSYWQLSDDLLWFTFQNILNKLPASFNFLDAGGGTGRWSIKILEKYKNSTGTIVDITKSMLNVAKDTANKRKVISRLTLVNDDLNNLNSIFKANTFNIVFNFHNVLGFVDSPKDILKNMYIVTKSKGYIVSFVPNIYHSIFFNLSQNKIDSANIIIKTKKGRYTKDMPYINFFTPRQIQELYSSLRLKKIFTTGFPSVIYPGYQETQIEGNTESIFDLLKDKNNYQKIFNIEKKLIYEPDIACRGNNLFISGIK